MPIYDYNCESCTHSFASNATKMMTSEEEQAAGLLPRCPSCGSTHVKRGIPKATSFQLKGGGWARDNYKGKGRK